MPRKKKDSYLIPTTCQLDEDGAYSLLDPVDFDEYTKMIASGTATEQHHSEFYLRMLFHFIESVDAGKAPYPWVMNALSKAFMKIVMGGRWEDEISLPWTEMSTPWSPAEQKSLDAFCDIGNTTSNKITDAIRIAAEKNNMSFESARAAYYKNKTLINK